MKRSAFTYVELMIVVAILIVIALIAIPNLSYPPYKKLVGQTVRLDGHTFLITAVERIADSRGLPTPFTYVAVMTDVTPAISVSLDADRVWKAAEAAKVER